MMGAFVTLVMVAMEFIFVTGTTLTKAAMNGGMSQFVYVFYANGLAIFILLFCSFFFYRKRSQTPITGCILCKILLASTLGCCAETFMFMGIKYSSPTLTSAMFDLTPAFTFLIAVTTRMEKLDLRLRSSQAKSIGTVVSIGGALIATLYKGPPVHFTAPSLKNSYQGLHPSNWVFGGVCSGAAALCASVIYVVQAWILRDYPEEVMLTLIDSVFTTGLCGVVALVAERDNPDAWKLKSATEYITIVFVAVFAVTLMSIVHAWANRKKGPVYTVAFKPLQIAIAVLFGVSFLGDALYVGSVIGAIILVSGFYAVIWGKSQEEKLAEEGGNSCIEPSSPKVPLLQDKKRALV